MGVAAPPITDLETEVAPPLKEDSVGHSSGVSGRQCPTPGVRRKRRSSLKTDRTPPTHTQDPISLSLGASEALKDPHLPITLECRHLQILAEQVW